MWGCGLKFDMLSAAIDALNVTPYVGVWIEITTLPQKIKNEPVTPYVGVWIEIFLRRREQFMLVCHPLCGGVD